MSQFLEWTDRCRSNEVTLRLFWLSLLLTAVLRSLLRPFGVSTMLDVMISGSDHGLKHPQSAIDHAVRLLGKRPPSVEASNYVKCIGTQLRAILFDGSKPHESWSAVAIR